MVRPLARSPAEFDDAAGDNLLPGTDGDDRRWGMAGNDTIPGQGGTDTLVGDWPLGLVDAGRGDVVSGDDVLAGGSGYDNLVGDVLALEIDGSLGGASVTLGSDLIADPDYGLVFGDLESLTVSTVVVPGSVIGLTAGDDTIASADGEIYGDAYNIEIKSVLGGALVLDLGDDRILTAGSSRVFGDAYYMWIEFFGGASGAIEVNAGNDFIVSLNGAQLYGDFDWFGVFNGSETSVDASVTVACGDDTLFGGNGNDWMAGDFSEASASGAADIQFVSGADTFVFTADFGDDVIIDFNPGLDSLEFRGFGDMAFGDLAFGVEAGEFAGLVVIVDDDQGNGTILLRGIDAISEADVVFT